MTIEKNGNVITLVLNDEENNAVDYFMKTTNNGILHEYFDHFIQTRIDTAKLDQKIEVMEIFNSMTPEQQEEFLNRGLQ